MRKPIGSGGLGIPMLLSPPITRLGGSGRDMHVRRLRRGLHGREAGPRENSLRGLLRDIEEPVGAAASASRL